ncbi:M1 family metallopeptidase [Gallaecimonas sp. GXIMD4217]|uniref:M1 family metallopeptidase n=1 Tax=Gallaecimonas sp. GXIMD4217 TaxID=3131927 RepID=UPI00311B3AF3
MRLFSLIAATMLLAASFLARADQHSFANHDQLRVSHLSLDLTVNFDRKVLDGNVVLDIRRLDQDARTLILDTRDLHIRKVEQNSGNGWLATGWQLKEADANLGSALHIQLPRGAHQVRVHYRTSPKASGLQWLAPEQTAGKRHPFLFSQAQAIHARSFIPLQDSPAVRVTYDAVIRTPRELLAVMSAEMEQDPVRDGEYHFNMPQPIPSYLIALGVGDLAVKPMSQRTAVYAEPAVLEAAAWEFADTEAMMEKVEAMYGAYPWGRYDLLILPPSFPFGGMENPRLSFITPTVIAGDKSLVSLIAHELAHSWSGNLVTNGAWRDLWLNEGFTTYLTYRIMEALYGKDRERMEALLGYNELLEDIDQLDPRDTKLALELAGRDPDDAFSDIPYEKGALMLFELEAKVGRERFDAFIKDYFSRFAFQSMDTERFLAHMEATLVKEGKVELDRLKAWIFQPGLPDGAPKPSSQAFVKVKAELDAWLAGDKGLAQLPTRGWNTQQWIYFIYQLPDSIGKAQLAELDKAFAFSGANNSEIAHAWYRQAIEHDYQPAFTPMEGYLQRIGRRRLVVPLYKMLMEKPQYQGFAKAAYEKARPGYHPLAQGTLDQLVR